MKRQITINKVGNTYIAIGITLCIISLSLLTYPQLPYIFNWLSLNTPEQEEKAITTTIYEEEIKEEKSETEEETLSLPDIDNSLPEENYLIIPNIGINAEIQKGNNSMIALAGGPWIVPDYATPESRYLQETSKSIIIASHRFGYSSWSEEKRNLISFFNLPNTKVEDNVIIIWNQREYLYEIVNAEQNTYIKDYDTDLILYTCKYYNSDARIFRYADLVSINGESVE